MLRTGFLTLTWIPVAAVVANHFCHVARVEGSSMRPTLNPTHGSTDWVLLFRGPFATRYNKGDVVLSKSPLDPKHVLCKRVKGVGGDHINPMWPHPYSRGSEQRSVLIPRGHVWLEGDNCYHSIDSNDFGPVSTGLLLGRCVAVIWPPSRWNAKLDECYGREPLEPVDELTGLSSK